jgi:hypothetical protein
LSIYREGRRQGEPGHQRGALPDWIQHSATARLEVE